MLPRKDRSPMARRSLVLVAAAISVTSQIPSHSASRVGIRPAGVPLRG
jgi:hypothetical protein